MKSSQNHPGQSYFLSSFSKNTRLKRSVHESVCELLNAGFTAEHMENYKSVQKDRMLAHALQWPQDHLWWWIKLWSPLYMNSSAAWVSVFLICKMGMKWNNVCKGSSSVPSIQQTLKKYDYFLHLDSVLLHRALRGNRMKQEGRQKSWPQKWLWLCCTYVQSYNSWNSFCIRMCYCTAHKLHTVICLTPMTALENQHYFLFMDKVTEALKRDEVTSPGQS